MSINEITGKKMQTGVASKAYCDNYDSIFKKKYPEPKSMDSAYQRQAIEDGFVFKESALFEENVQYYKDRHASSGSL